MKLFYLLINKLKIKNTNKADCKKVFQPKNPSKTTTSIELNFYVLFYHSKNQQNQAIGVRYESSVEPELKKTAFRRFFKNYFNCSTSCISYKPADCWPSHTAARTAPLAKVNRLDALWVISTRSPISANITVCSPTRSPTLS